MRSTEDKIKYPLLWESPMVAPAQLQTYTAVEFLKLELPEGEEYELIVGFIVPMAEPSGQHENLRSELLFSLRLASKRANLGLLIHWEEDYRNKPLWYAAFGVREFWIVDPLFHLDRYPGKRNPKILQPTISIDKLVPSESILVENEYHFVSFAGNDCAERTLSERIKSQFFPDLDLTVEQIVAFGEGI